MKKNDTMLLFHKLKIKGSISNDLKERERHKNERSGQYLPSNESIHHQELPATPPLPTPSNLIKSLDLMKSYRKY